MCTLAAGAVAAFASLVLGMRPYWLILILALPLTWLLHACGCLYRPRAGAIAALAVLVAALYAINLDAVARIAAVTGRPFGDAFRTGGIALMWQVAELGLHSTAVAVIVTAAALAALLARWLAHRRRAASCDRA